MHVCIPVQLNLDFNDDRHTMAVYRKFSNPMSLVGNVQATIAETKDKALDLLLDEIRVFIQSWQKDYPCLEAKDFILTYSSDKVNEGRFWATTSCTTTCRCK